MHVLFIHFFIDYYLPINLFMEIHVSSKRFFSSNYNFQTDITPLKSDTYRFRVVIHQWQ